MAISDEFLAIVVSVGIMYLFLYNHKTRWVRMLGSFGIIIVALGAGVVADEIEMYIFFLVNLMVGGYRFVMEVASLTQLDKPDSILKWH